MQRPNAIVLESDSSSASALAAALHRHCRSVYVARSPEEVRVAVPKHRANILIADLELMRLPEIQRLHNEYGGVSIVCTHRIPDEEMWAESLQAGAVDCCYSSDVSAIMNAALQDQHLAQSKAA
jgi:DNA-binding NtrC family response regulator